MARFRVTHRVRSSQITEEIWFHRDLAGVWLDVRVDWQEPCGPEAGVPQLKLAFAASLRAPRARFEGPFSVVERPADGLETVTQKWADLTGDEGGFTLCNDSRYGCDALGGRLRVTLVRNAYSPDPCSDRGVHRVQLAFEPHGAAADAEACVRRGLAFNRPLLAVPAAGPPACGEAWLELPRGSGVVCTSLCRAAGGEGIVARLFEARGRRERVQVRLARSPAAGVSSEPPR